MKKATVIITALFIVFIFAMAAFAQEATENTTSTGAIAVTDTATESTTTFNTIMSGLGFGVGLDNIYGAFGTDEFFATGLGVDIAQFSKSLKYGGKLNLYLHGVAATVTSGVDKGTAIFGASGNVDAISLITGTPLTLLTKEMSLVIGPTVLYNAGSGKIGYGGLFNLTYTF